MSFSFHDLFPSEDGESDSGSFQKGASGFSGSSGKATDADRGIFSQPPQSKETEARVERSFLVSELLPFIPPAISAQSGIPMQKEVTIPMPADGSNEVRLSTIFQVCPELFAAEITPLNDSEVTLPVKLGGISSDAGFPDSPFAPGKNFGKASGAKQPESRPESGSENPFWSPSEASGEKKNPPREEREDTDSGTSFGGFDEPSSSAKAKPAPDPPSDDDPVASGFSGEPFSGGEKMFTLFSNKDEGEEENDTSAGEEAAPESAGTTPNWGSMFQPPARQEHDPGPPPAAGKEDELEVAEELRQEPREEPGEKESEFSGFDPSGFESSDPNAEHREPSKPEPAKISPEKTTSQAPEPSQREEPAEAAAPASVIERSSTVRTSEGDDLADVELRAIFSTSERFTLAKVARKLVGLPGISACALSGAGKVVQATRSEENRLGADAQDMVDAVRNIAKLTGMESAKSFTMKTEYGIVSLFLEGDCCLSVNHEKDGFEPGVREKLIVIARSLHKLTE